MPTFSIGSLKTNELGSSLCPYCERQVRLGTLTKVEGKADPRYTGLVIHDFRRSAIKNLMKAGVNEKVAMKISGHQTRAVFDRYHIMDTEDVVDAMRRVQAAVPVSKGLVPNGEKIVKVRRPRQH